MAPLELEGSTLGSKHRFYNKLLQEAITNDLSRNIINDQADDIKNLLEIDLANHNKNVETILKAFQSSDSLYSSQAIKRCMWLIKEDTYAHIINPEYLHSELSPLMTKKAFNKLMLRIRLTLKDEKRVEEFYKYEKQRDEESAFKWLQHCSLPFVIKVVEEFKNEIPENILERLFKRSFSVFDIYTKDNDDTWKVMQKSKYLLNMEPEKYLNILKTQSHFARPRFTAKNTKLIMKKSPQIILKNLEGFMDQIHLPTLAKYMKSQDVPEFLTHYTKLSRSSITFHKLKYFVRHMPKEGKFESIKSVFIDKNDIKERSMEGNINLFWPKAIKDAYLDTDTYRWYFYAPFNVAFQDLSKLIQGESSPSGRIKILSVLVDCTKRNPENIKTLLNYYKAKHINEPYILKAQFIDILLKKTDSHRYDKETWAIMNQLFLSIEIYAESTRDAQKYIEHIIMYNVIHNLEVPKIIERKFKFTTFKAHQPKLNSFEKNKVFDFLFEYMTKCLSKTELKSKHDFEIIVACLRKIFSLFKDWDKDLKDYPQVVSLLKELIVINEKNGWNADLMEFYDFKKSWRQVMFEESLVLYPSEESCINVIKHDPQLLQRYEISIEKLRRDDSVSLRRVLKKLRIYWPQTLAVSWRNAYLKRLESNPQSGHKSLIEGIILLTQTEQLRVLIKKYAPEESKINWHEDNLIMLGLRKNIANKLYLARPPPAVDDILLYAKGDYVQHAIPSLVSTIHNLNHAQSKIDLMKLINGPVSLQKFGIRFALIKIYPEELTTLFMDIWKSTKNLSIRTVLFTTTFKMLKKEKNVSVGERILEMLCTFIDNLSNEEDKIIYKKLSEVNDVPSFAKGKYYEKCYFFLKSLPAKSNCEGILKQVINSSTELMEYLDPAFVRNELLKECFDTFHIQYCDVRDIIASYLLCCKDQKTQQEKYDSILYPLLERYLKSWDHIHNGKKYVKINFNDLFTILLNRVWNTIAVDNVVIPHELFFEVYLRLSTTQEISVVENYRLITMWKLVTAIMKALNEKSKIITETDSKKTHCKQMARHRTYGYNTKIWNDYFVTCIPLFVKEWIRYLKEDVDKYDASVFYLYKEVLADLFSVKFYISHSDLMEITKYIMLESNNCIHSYLLAIYLCPESLYEDSEKSKFQELQTIILKHPSPIVKMHFHEKYYDKQTCRN